MKQLTMALAVSILIFPTAAFAQTELWHDTDIKVANSAVERHSWGHVLVRGTNATPGHQPIIYLLDSGVGAHVDLPNIEYPNFYDPRVRTPWRPDLQVPVGCYAHATHVAGIIAAKGSNGGTAGAYAGAKIISVAWPTREVKDQNGRTICIDVQRDGDSNFTDLKNQTAALRWIRNDILTNNPRQTGVVNISFNHYEIPGDTSFTEALNDFHQAMIDLATPTPDYKGVVVVQSAGNSGGDATKRAYASPDGGRAVDGIIVVGGLLPDGHIAGGIPNDSPANPPASAPPAYCPWGYTTNTTDVPSIAGFLCYQNFPGSPGGAQPTSQEFGSNFGPNVEIYAPSFRIYSTTGAVNSAYQTSGTVASAYDVWSGTSMAAPFVTAAVAALIQEHPEFDSKQIEQTLEDRSYTSPIQQSDARCPANSDCPVKIVGPIGPAVPFDQSGDGRADILWTYQYGATDAAPGSIASWKMNGGFAYTEQLYPTIGGSGWTIVGVGDFNGDRKTDILWRHGSGSVGVWLMDGNDILQAASIYYDGQADFVPNEPYNAFKIGDLNGDGKSDILFVHSNGQVDGWMMDGVSRIDRRTLLGPSSTWFLIGAGDMNGDGKADLLWRGFMNGTWSYGTWLMDGFDTVGYGQGRQDYVAPAGFVEDANGVKNGLLVQDLTTSEVRLWPMTNGGFSQPAISVVAGNWNVLGVANFDQAAKRDVVLSDSSGQSVFIKLAGSDGNTPQPAIQLLPGNTAWFVSGIRDISGDRRSDLIWSTYDGQRAAWIRAGNSWNYSFLPGSGVMPSPSLENQKWQQWQ